MKKSRIPLYADFLPQWRAKLIQGMDEDLSHWDWSTDGLGARKWKTVRAKILCKEEGIWCGQGLLRAVEGVSSDLEGKITVKSNVKDGSRVRKGQVIAEWTGPARMVLKLERPFLNLAGYFSGIATETSTLVKKISRTKAKSRPRLVSTRKTLPGYRDLAVYSVLVGGGGSHRTGLGSGILLKENHLKVAGGIPSIFPKIRESAPHSFRLEVEVQSLRELKEAISNGAEAVLLDNFKPEKVKKAVRIAKGKVKIEVSGGISQKNIEQYAIDGVDYISVGRTTHSVKSMDLSLLI